MQKPSNMSKYIEGEWKIGIPLQGIKSSGTKEVPKKFSFNWNEIANKDSDRFLRFLSRNLNLNWAKTAKIEKIDAGRTILISSGTNYLTLSLNNESTKAILKINDFKEYEFIAKTENGKLNIYPKPKVAELIERWIHPVNNYNLKMWIHPPNSIYYFPSIGIGLGTIFKPNIFSFALLDTDSIQWFEKTLIESLEVYNKNKKLKNKSIYRWEEKKELDKLRKISIALSVVKNKDDTSMRLMLNSKNFIYTDLYPDDIDWLLTTLSIAKDNLEALQSHESN